MKIVIINRSTSITTPLLKTYAAAIQKQIVRDFAPAYGYGGTLDVRDKGAAISFDEWPLYVDEKAPSGGYQGFHDETGAGKPIAYVFVKESKQDLGVSITLSHEVLEMLGNPFIDACSMGISTKVAYVAYEVCDPVQNDTYTIDGVAVSNFVYPNYFGLDDPAPYDHLKRLKKPLSVGNGYQIYAGQDRVWTSRNAAELPVSVKDYWTRTTTIINSNETPTTQPISKGNFWTRLWNWLKGK